MNSDEEAVLNEVQQVVDNAARKARKAQSVEQVAAMPHLYRMAQDLIRKEGSYEPLGVHLLAIREAEGDNDLSKIENPLGVSPDSAMAAEFVLTHTFANVSDALDGLRSVVASILFWEASKKRPTSLLLVTHDNLLVNYFGRKLTVSRATIGDDMVTNHVDITDDDTEPNEFFDRCSLNDSERMLVTSLMGLVETARLIERESPASYKLQCKRVEDAMRAKRLSDEEEQGD